jgi:hypothetical protein
MSADQSTGAIAMLGLPSVATTWPFFDDATDDERRERSGKKQRSDDANHEVFLLAETECRFRAL